MLQRYCLVGELGAATTIMRHFWWHRNVLWLDDIPDRLKGRMVVAMGSKDFVAPADAVMRYLSLDSRVRTLLARGGQPSCCLLEALHSCMGDALLAGEHVQWAGQSEQARNRALKMFAEIHLDLDVIDTEVSVAELNLHSNSSHLEGNVDSECYEQDHLLRLLDIDHEVAGL